jgi:hypothetical protein
MHVLLSFVCVLLLCVCARAQNAPVTDTYHCGIGMCAATFDPSSMGGNWSCYGPAGSCGPGEFVNHFDAACAGGSTSDTEATANWRSYGHILGKTQAKLRIPSGAVCAFGTNQSLVCDTISDNGDTLVNNAFIWGYGATWDRMQLGGNGFRADGAGQGFSSALIEEADAGDTTVTIRDGNVSMFHVGDWVIISGLAGQGSGFGPTHQYHEHRQIAWVDGDTLGFADGLAHSYRTDWPNFNVYNAGQGGPAQVYRMANCFDTTVVYAGLTLTTPASQVQNNMTGKSVVLQDMTVQGGLGPGGMVEGHIIGGWYATIEVDKNNDLFSLDRAYVSGNIAFQSASTTPSFITDSRIDGSVVGTPAELTIRGSVILGDLQVGATCCGQSRSLTLDTTYYGNGRPAGQEIDKNKLEYDDNGTFTISLGNYQTSNFPGLFVPGHKYFLGDSHGDNNCTPTTIFRVRKVVNTRDNLVQIKTSLKGPLPTLACADGLNFSTIARFGLLQLKQTNVTYGKDGLWNSKILAPR